MGGLRMKLSGLLLVFLVCFSAVDGFCGAAKQYRFQPLTGPLINYIENNLGEDVRDLGYYLSAPLVMISKDDGLTGRIDMSGRLIVTEKKNTLEYRITSSDKGTWNRESSADKTTFVIDFLGRFRLTFKKNAESGGFDLVDAEDTRNVFEYKPVASDNFHTPHLRIYYRYNINNRNQLLDLADAPGQNGQSGQTAQPRQSGQPGTPPIDPQLVEELQAVRREAGQLTGELQTARGEAGRLAEELQAVRREAGQLTEELQSAREGTAQFRQELEGAFDIPPIPPMPTPPTPPTPPPPTPDSENPEQQITGRSIEGRGSLERNDMIGYVRSINPNASQRDVEVLIDAYIREAQRENINHDIAVAQMCYATNYLRDRQLMNDHNYGGFDAIKGTPVRYANMNEGVRAHIQHLKGYTSRETPQGNIVDKRYTILINEGILGTVKTLDGLSRFWAPNNQQNYGNRINSILEDMYRISGR